MQTFLPYKDFYKSAESLDYRRLGKQRVETYQILRSLTGLSKGWVNHPCTKMWKGYESTLRKYGIAICETWIKLGYKDSLLEKISNINVPETDEPPWLNDPELHRSHKSNLLRKDKEFYGKLWPDVPDNLPYVWPVN
jgi:hypothetical protein